MLHRKNLNIEGIIKIGSIRESDQLPDILPVRIILRNRVLFDLLGAEKMIGAELTENFAMMPPATVSGYIFFTSGVIPILMLGKSVLTS